MTVRKSGQLVLTEAAVALLGEGVEQVQIGYNDKARAVGIKAATEGGRGVLKLRAQPNGRSRLIDAKRFFSHHSLSVSKARGIEVEDFGGGVVGFRLPEEGASGEADLSPQALAILEDLHDQTGGSPWVLESPRKPGRHLTTIKTAMQGILKRTEMRPWSPHDLRRTAASKMRAMGVSRRVVQGILNHKDRSVTAIYDRYGADPEKQQALTEWGRRVEEIAGGERGAGGWFQERGKSAR